MAMVREQIRWRKPLAYTTVLSVMQKLEKAGWLEHRVEGRTYVYAPLKSQQEAGQKTVRKLVDRVFGGDPLLLFEHLLGDQELTAQDLSSLRSMIDKRRKELQTDNSKTKTDTKNKKQGDRS